jgi:PKD repeat protein
MFTDLTIKAIDHSLNMFNNTADIVKQNSVKELHTYQDKGVEIVNLLTENVKELLTTTSIEKVFTHSK